MSIATRQHTIRNKLRKHQLRAMKLGLRANYITVGQWKSKVLSFGYKCAYCKHLQTKEERLTFDHLVPIGRGGGHFLGNLVPACMKCNNEKGARMLQEWKPDHYLVKENTNATQV